MSTTCPGRRPHRRTGAWGLVVLLACSGSGPGKGKDDTDVPISEACLADCPDGTGLVSYSSEELVVSDAFLVVEGECQSFCEALSPCVWPNLPRMVAGPNGGEFQCAPVEGFSELPGVAEVDFGWAGVPEFPDPITADSSLGLEADWVASGDVDGDGDDDVLVGSTTYLEALVSDGAGGFATGVQTLDDTVLDAVAGQLDGDSFVDLVVLALGVDGDQRLRVLTGVGDGSFTVGPDLVVLGAIGRWPSLADLDADGNLDVLGQGPAVGGVFVMWGDGAGGFTAPQVLTGACGFCNKTPVAMRRSGSGRLDVVNELGGWRNDGGRAFTEDVTLTTGIDLEWGPDTHGVVDLDQDGLDDLVLAGGGTATWFPGVDLAPRSLVSLCPYGTQVAVGDLNGDGTDDALFGDATCSNLTHVLPTADGPRAVPVEGQGGHPVVGSFGPGLPAGVGVVP